MASATPCSQESQSISADILRDLQESMLRAIISQTPLPNCKNLLFFPDIRSVIESTELVVSDANLAGSLHLELPVRLLNNDELRRLAEERNNVPYLQFTDVLLINERLTLALEMRIAFADISPLSLGIVRAEAQKGISGGWQFVNAVAIEY